jgi:hypothetical protein
VEVRIPARWPTQKEDNYTAFTERFDFILIISAFATAKEKDSEPFWDDSPQVG